MAPWSSSADTTSQVAELRAIHINWSRGTRWEGVCGKVRPNGVFSTAGGVKDSAGASYRALVDPTNPFYSKVRDLKREEQAA